MPFPFQQGGWVASIRVPLRRHAIAMWSDTLLTLERAHLLRLLAWGAMSVVAGTGLLAWLVIGRSSSTLLRNFSVQTSLWGLVNLAIAGRGLLRLAERDFGSATRFDRILWMSTGLDIGVILVGVTLAATGWIVGRRLGAVGAGLGVMLQGAGLLLLDLRFVSITARVF